MSQIYSEEHHCTQQTGLDLLFAIKVSVYTEDGSFPAHFGGLAESLHHGSKCHVVRRRKP